MIYFIHHVHKQGIFACIMYLDIEASQYVQQCRYSVLINRLILSCTQNVCSLPVHNLCTAWCQPIGQHECLMNACVVENASVLLLISSAIRFCKYINNELLYYFISLLQVCCKVCDKNLLVLAFIFKPNRYE